MPSHHSMPSTDNYMFIPTVNEKTFTSGHMLMFTSPEDPYAALPRLRTRESRSQGVLKGYYRMAGNQVNLPKYSTRGSRNIYVSFSI